ncbi:hypothetical protein ON010_g12093 [Phytophthora cinnamomi]|nr:hypothetical protein ON010_g12093 [Phytophthora cinnamomi]
MRFASDGVVRLMELFENNESLFLVMELCGQELFEFIDRNGPLPESTTRPLIRKLVRTVAYLHAQCIVHRDIKPENILLPPDSQDVSDIKLSDFGIARKLDGHGHDNVLTPHESLSEVANLHDAPSTNSSGLPSATDMVRNRMARAHTKCGTRDYIAPEVMSGKGYGTEADLWSVGVVTYVLASGCAPVFLPTAEGVKKVFFSDESWSGASEDLKRFIEALLVRNPEKRITAADACPLLIICARESNSAVWLKPLSLSLLLHLLLLVVLVELLDDLGRGLHELHHGGVVAQVEELDAAAVVAGRDDQHVVALGALDDALARVRHLLLLEVALHLAQLVHPEADEVGVAEAVAQHAVLVLLVRLQARRVLPVLFQPTYVLVVLEVDGAQHGLRRSRLLGEGARGLRAREGGAGAESGAAQHDDGLEQYWSTCGGEATRCVHYYKNPRIYPTATKDHGGDGWGGAQAAAGDVQGAARGDDGAGRLPPAREARAARAAAPEPPAARRQACLLVLVLVGLGLCRRLGGGRHGGAQAHAAGHGAGDRARELRDQSAGRRAPESAQLARGVRQRERGDRRGAQEAQGARVAGQAGQDVDRRRRRRAALDRALHRAVRGEGYNGISGPNRGLMVDASKEY